MDKIMMSFCSDVSFLLLLTLIFTRCSYAGAQDCSQSGTLTGTEPPEGGCSQECCEEGKEYATYNCSPPVTTNTAAILTLNNFEEGGDGGDRSECDEMYHSNDTLVVALSTGWFDNRSRCFKNIKISYNGTSVEAMVVDQCSSTNGCDATHAYQPPCRNNIVDASDAVWEGLGVPEGQRYAELEITWSDV